MIRDAAPQEVGRFKEGRCAFKERLSRRGEPKGTNVVHEKLGAEVLLEFCKRLRNGGGRHLEFVRDFADEFLLSDQLKDLELVEIENVGFHRRGERQFKKK